MFGKKNKHPETPVTASSAPKAATPGKATRPVAAGRDTATTQGRGAGKLAYEAKRAEKAGMGLEKWMAEKDRRARAEREAIAQNKRKSDAERHSQVAKPGLLRRLLDRAHKPI